MRRPSRSQSRIEKSWNNNPEFRSAGSIDSSWVKCGVEMVIEDVELGEHLIDRSVCDIHSHSVIETCKIVDVPEAEGEDENGLVRCVLGWWERDKGLDLAG